MSKDNQILKLFSHPVFKYKVSNFEKLNEELLKFIYNLQEKDNIGLKRSNVNGWHSPSFDLNDLEGKPYKFLSHISEYIKDVFKHYGWIYDTSKVKCTSMWSIINKKGSFNIEHIHSNNFLSAAYYVKAPKNCGKFKALTPNIISKNFFPKANGITELNALTAKINVTEGDLLIFPAYLPHSVEENKSDEDRVIISFNIDVLR